VKAELGGWSCWERESVWRFGRTSAQHSTSRVLATVENAVARGYHASTQRAAATRANNLSGWYRVASTWARSHSTREPGSFRSKRFRIRTLKFRQAGCLTDRRMTWRFEVPPTPTSTKWRRWNVGSLESRGPAITATLFGMRTTCGEYRLSNPLGESMDSSLPAARAR
jgi:hypothetical protein